MTPNPFRFFKPGDVVFVRMKLVRKANDEFGTWEAEPVNRFGQPTKQGLYLYVDELALVTSDEIKSAMKA